MDSRRKKEIESLYREHQFLTGLVFGDRENESSLDLCRVCGLLVTHNRELDGSRVITEGYYFRDTFGRVDITLREAIKQGCRKPRTRIEA